jgi:glutaminyl-peptide cyclotransferase
MERFRFRLVRDRKLLAGLLLVPLAGLFVAGTGVPWLGLFAPSHVVEASATMVDPPAPPPIDGKRAYAYLKQICEIGPRTAGSAANARQRELVKAHFKKMGGEIHEQPFQINHPQTGQQLNLCNLVGSWHPERIDRVLIAAHYDTRPHADEEVNPARRAMPFIGANDCASGVALLMEIANHLNNLNTQWGVDLVLLDGEELVFGNRPPVGEYFLGSKEFARIYAEQVAGKRTQTRYAAGILFDMIGGKNLRLPQDPYSVEHAPRLVDEVWSVAKTLDAKSFQKRMGREVTDDHIALNEAGIPTIDLIDFEYRFWHTIDDVPENCSAESLEQVGRVVTGWLAVPRNRARPRARR